VRRLRPPSGPDHSARLARRDRPHN
jgi:hypothetical protein